MTMPAPSSPIDDLKSTFEQYVSSPQAQPLRLEVQGVLKSMFAAIMELDRRTNSGGFLGDPDVLSNPSILR
ncbi:hypothetical protein [Bradyrhizobium sp.]|jgi:hypothetical protein|uniref:hypothetical protein n=2 Tax=Bradyrhizobium sp. TaxID=376 RepID=UPI003C7816E9